MDDLVKQAMVKWPHVPNCYGWLGLDTRGNWYMRDDRAQAIGGFDSGIPGAKGSLVQHQKLMEFIGRNYQCDAAGQWYFQNGPQKVFVELQATPWVWRIDALARVSSHTGVPATCLQATTDVRGWLYLETNLGFGLVHTQDVLHAADAIAQGLWHLAEHQALDLPARYRFVKSPYALDQARRALEKPSQ